MRKEITLQNILLYLFHRKKNLKRWKLNRNIVFILINRSSSGNIPSLKNGLRYAGYPDLFVYVRIRK